MVAAKSPVQNWNLGIGPIQCHAWNKDRTRKGRSNPIITIKESYLELAVSASSPTVHIFEVQRDGAWKEIHTLNEHDLPVTSVDWAPNTNRIVTCSMDKNAFVWTLANGQWKPELVIVRSNRAATSVKWSPLGRLLWIAFLHQVEDHDAVHKLLILSLQKTSSQWRLALSWCRCATTSARMIGGYQSR